MVDTQSLEEIEFVDEAPPEIGRPTTSRYDALRDRLMEPTEQGTYRWAKVATFAEGQRVNAQQRAGSIRNKRGSWASDEGSWDVRLTAGEVKDGKPVKGSGFALWVRFAPQVEDGEQNGTGDAETVTESKPRRGRRGTAPAAEQAS